MGFITRLSVEPEHESTEEESARLLLRTEVTNACMDAVNRDVVVRVKASQCDCDAKCQCPRNFMEPGQLARFILELSSFADSQSLSRVMWMMLTIDRGSRPHWEIRWFWLPFWHRLVNMDASSLEACAPAFWRMLQHYNNFLRLKYQGQREVVHYLRHNPVGGSDPSSTTTDSLQRGVYDWLTNPMSTAALVAKRPLHRLETHYDGLHGEYLSTRVTPIPGTDQGELLIVKRFQNTIKDEDDDEDVKPFGNILCMIRAELEWRLFTEFRPMLLFLSDEHLISLLGHSVKLDRDVGSLDDAYLEAFNVPSTQKFILAPEITIEPTPAPTVPLPRVHPVVKTEPDRPGVRRRPRVQLIANAEPTAPLPQPSPVVKTERQHVRLAHRVPRAQLLVNAEPSANSPRSTGEAAARVPAARAMIMAESPVSSSESPVQADELDTDDGPDEESAPVPAARAMIKSESPVSSPEPPAQADDMDAERGAKEEAQDADVVMVQDVPAAESPAQADAGEDVEPRARRGVKRRASDVEQPPRRMGLRSRQTGGG